MPPRTRSSVSSLPATPSARSINSTSTTTPRTTPRKVPHCTKCGNPRAGHPRSGCPFQIADSPVRGKQEPDLTNALSSLHIQTLASDTDKNSALGGRRVKAQTAPDASLASLSSTSSDVVNRLLRPGIMGNDTDEEDEAQVKRWQEAIVTPSKPTRSTRARPYMPCTLNTPNSSFFASQGGFPEDVKPSSQEKLTSTLSTTRTLSRTLSTEERTAFLNELASLSTVAPATSFQLLVSDIATLQGSANKLGFHTRVVLEDDGVKGLLILGRDEVTVESLFRAVNRNVGEETGKRTSNQGAAFAGGAVVGAVATFTGLAFS